MDWIELWQLSIYLLTWMVAKWMNLKMELAFGVNVWSEIALVVRQLAQGVYIIYIYKYETAGR